MEIYKTLIMKYCEVLRSIAKYCEVLRSGGNDHIEIVMLRIISFAIKSSYPEFPDN